MSRKYETFWTNLVRKYHRVEKTPMSVTELEQEIAKLSVKPMSEHEIESIVDAVSRGECPSTEPEPDFDWIEEVDTSSVEEGVLQLNRNKGDTDSDIQKQMEEFRKHALEESNDEKNDVESD